jgi:hypothetical protein
LCSASLPWCHVLQYMIIIVLFIYLFRLELALRRTSAIVSRPGRRRPLRAPPLPRRQRQHRRRVRATPASVQRRRPSRGLELRLRAIGWRRPLRRRSLWPAHKWYAFSCVVCLCSFLPRRAQAIAEQVRSPRATRRSTAAIRCPLPSHSRNPFPPLGLLTPFPPSMGCTPRRRPLRIRDPTAPRGHSSNPSNTRMFRYARVMCAVW